MLETIYLSRRNLLTLLSKLDRRATGDETACTLIKYDNTTDPYRPSMDSCRVIAVEDKDYYITRESGIVHPADDPNNVSNRQS
jgi:hypothetical protein